jgi:hypothetical protein
MLRQLGQHIAAAHEHAREYHERVLATADESRKTDLIKLENAWLELAKQFETLKSMENFLLDTAKQMGLNLWA